MKYLFISVAILFAGCATHTTAPSAPAGPSGSVDEVAAYLPYITTASTIATGAVLQFAVKDSATRTDLANEIWSASAAEYSLTTGVIPTPDQLKSAVLSFGGSDTDATYATYAENLSSLYALYFPKIQGNPKLAIEVLSAIAKGAQSGASAYTTVSK